MVCFIFTLLISISIPCHNLENSLSESERSVTILCVILCVPPNNSFRMILILPNNSTSLTWNHFSVSSFRIKGLIAITSILNDPTHHPPHHLKIIFSQNQLIQMGGNRLTNSIYFNLEFVQTRFMKKM